MARSLTRFARALLLLPLASGVAAAQVTRTLTFDAGDPIGGLAVGSILGNQYAAFGVTFSPNIFSGPGGPTGPWATNTDRTVVSSTGSDVGGLGTPSLVSGNLIRSFNSWLAENGDASMLASFSVGVDQISIDFAGIAAPSSTRLFVFDGSTQIGLVTAAASGQQRLSFTAGAGQTITSVRFTPGDFFDWVGWDNFTYRTTPSTVVPEPSTYALLATGLLGLVGVARRRKS